jgi:hypothetical protein
MKVEDDRSFYYCVTSYCIPRSICVSMKQQSGITETSKQYLKCLILTISTNSQQLNVIPVNNVLMMLTMWEINR